MVAEIFEGTREEILRKLGALTVAPETRLRVLVTEAEAPSIISAEPFHATEFRNGVPLLPRRALLQAVTLEMIEQLLQAETNAYHSVAS
jgi:hypothetical protein